VDERFFFPDGAFFCTRRVSMSRVLIPEGATYLFRSTSILKPFRDCFDCIDGRGPGFEGG
jgi:hypothetical protein